MAFLHVIKYQSVIDFLFVIVVFITTRQVPFSMLSPLMNIALVLLVVFSLYRYRLNSNEIKIVISLLLLPLAFSFFYSSILTDNKLSLALRFFIILISIGLAYFVKVSERALKWFIYLCVFQSFCLILALLFIYIFVGYENYLPVRFYVQQQGWGDLYTYNGIFYRIQIKGSALLVIAFILNVETDLIKSKLVVAMFLLIGIILAGNFAFLISIAIYFLYMVLRLRNKRSLNYYQLSLFALGICLIFILPYAYNFVVSTLADKKDESLGARYDQTQQLLKDLFRDAFSLTLGRGLGNTLDVTTQFRNYSGLSYYELQVVYLFNQLGIIFSFCYLLYQSIIVSLKWGRSTYIVIIYIIYLIYSVTNPYIFDTNHFIVIVVLNSLIIYDREKRCTNYLIEPC